MNLSDIAAMGATPRWALLARALPDSDPAWLAAFARGLLRAGRCARRRARRRRHDARAAQPVRDDPRRSAGRARRSRRAGARAGDDIYVSGGWATPRWRSRRCAGASRSMPPRWRVPRPARAAGAARRARAAAARHGDRDARCVRRTDRRSRAHPRASARRRRRRSRHRCRVRRRSPRSWRRRARAGAGNACSRAATTTSCASPRAPADARARSSAIARELGAAADAHRRDRRGARAGRPRRAGRGDRVAARIRSLSRAARRDDVHRRCAFLVPHPAHFIALGFGAGLAPVRARHLRHAGGAADRVRRCGRTPAMSASSSRSACCLRSASGLGGHRTRPRALPITAPSSGTRSSRSCWCCTSSAATTCASPSRSCCSACSTS